eukprot:3334287-Amphidinium_carterae.1
MKYMRIASAAYGPMLVNPVMFPDSQETQQSDGFVAAFTKNQVAPYLQHYYLQPTLALAQNAFEGNWQLARPCYVATGGSSLAETHKFPLSCDFQRLLFTCEELRASLPRGIEAAMRAHAGLDRPLSAQSKGRKSTKLSPNSKL